MKVILSGYSGTLAPYIKEALEQRGHDVILWDHKVLLIDDKPAIKAFLDQHKPDVFFHIATGPESWLETIIELIKPMNLPLLFTSTESVFDDSQQGPFSTNTPPLAKGDYGQYKIRCEKIISANYPDQSYIVRIGWQIALTPEKNNMLYYLVAQEQVEASTEWILSTSFMPDTANALIDIVEQGRPGLYHVDGNLENWDYFTLVTELKEAFNLPIEVIKSNAFKRNNRLQSDILLVKSIQERIAEIKGSIK